MSDRICAGCGKSPADGYASIYRDGEQFWYCHGDEGTDVSCYIDAQLDLASPWIVQCDRCGECGFSALKGRYSTSEEAEARAVRHRERCGTLHHPEALLEPGGSE